MKRAQARQELRVIARETQGLLRQIRAAGIEKVPGRSTSSPSSADKEQLLEPVRRKALQCQACRLCKERNHVVFGEGSLNAELMFVGEGPGREEDLQGRPFVGSAGTLLTKILQAMGLSRESVYIANAVKCRPPQNRPPEPDEIEACRGFLETQIRTIRPRLICALGRTAVTTLLQTQAPMSALRGKTFEWEGIPLIVTFHPAYLLRNPPAKKEVWEDMKRAMEILKKG